MSGRKDIGYSDRGTTRVERRSRLNRFVDFAYPLIVATIVMGGMQYLGVIEVEDWGIRIPGEIRNFFRLFGIELP